MNRQNKAGKKINQSPEYKPHFSARFTVAMAVIVMVIQGVAAIPCRADSTDDSNTRSESSILKTHSAKADDQTADVSFPTIYKSGYDFCTNEDGKPVILLFSSSSCSHCEWVGGIFDTIVDLYIADGLIEAHHYDINTGDDLLTEEVETQIPPAYLKLKEQGDPKGYVPYFNFSCKYERVGNGYEKADDPVAEAAEMRKVIDTVIRMSSKGG